MKKGFSLIELIAVLLILLILAALILPKLTQASYKRNLMVCSENLKKLGVAFQQYVMENNGYAPYNPNAGDLKPPSSSTEKFSSNGGDYFMSYELAYKLGPYLGDASHEKFKKGNMDVVRCPGNCFDFYPEGGSIIGEDGGKSSWVYNYNRQAPTTWPYFHSISNVSSGSECSPGHQVMDYQYNMSLGGTISSVRTDWVNTKSNTITEGINAVYYQTHNPYYKLDFIMRHPSEAVIFCDINYANVKIDEKTQQFVYGYLKALAAKGKWRDPSVTPISMSLSVGKVRTNELIHEGKGINAVFIDGHVEFLPGTSCFGVEMMSWNDDLMNWGISYPIVFPLESSPAKQIPGVHGFRRGAFSVCIEHDEKKQVEVPRTTKCWGGELNSYL